MQKADTEKQIFLQLCGEKDRILLTETEKMNLGDFDRLTYITDFLGFTSYNLKLWNEVSPQFTEQFQCLMRLMEDCDVTGWTDETEGEYHLHDMWLMDFLRNIPKEDIRENLKEVMQRLYKEEGWEFPEQEYMP